MCLDFGGQNHITKAVIKSRQLLSYTRSVSSRDLGTELLKCVFFASQFAQKSLEMKPRILVNLPFKCKTLL